MEESKKILNKDWNRFLQILKIENFNLYERIKNEKLQFVGKENYGNFNSMERKLTEEEKKSISSVLYKLSQ